MQGTDTVFPIQYRFHWDEVKANANSRKHGVSFEQAKALLNDPLSAIESASESFPRAALLLMSGTSTKPADIA